MTRLLQYHEDTGRQATVKKALSEAMVSSASDDLTLAKANADFALICDQLIDAICELKSSIVDKDAIEVSLFKAMHLLANRVVGNDLASKASIAKVPQKHRQAYAQKYSDLRRSSALNPEEGARSLTPAARISAIFAAVETSRVAAETHVNALPKETVAHSAPWQQKHQAFAKRKHNIMASLGGVPAPVPE
jgi:hypothetical protein